MSTSLPITQGVQNERQEGQTASDNIDAVRVKHALKEERKEPIETPVAKYNNLFTNVLLKATEENNASYVKFLLDSNADPNVQDHNKDTPLIIACSNGYL